jgi:hypothetical protein
MEIEQILDKILKPRPGGSDNLDAVARFPTEYLASTGVMVSDRRVSTRLITVAPWPHCYYWRKNWKSDLHKRAAPGSARATVWGPDRRPQFLAHGIEAITLRSFDGDQFPRDLHSEYDSRDRLSIKGIVRSVGLLKELVNRSDISAGTASQGVL